MLKPIIVVILVGIELSMRAAPVLETRLEQVVQAQSPSVAGYLASIRTLHGRLLTCDYPSDVMDVQAVTCVFEQFHPVYQAYEQVRRNTLGIDMRTLGSLVIHNDFEIGVPQGKVVHLLPFMEEFLDTLPEGLLKKDMRAWKKKLEKYAFH